MKRRISRYAIGIMAGWALTVLAPGVVAGLVVYQFNVVRVPIAPTLVSGVRAEATVVVASDTSNGRVGLEPVQCQVVDWARVGVPV